MVSFSGMMLIPLRVIRSGAQLFRGVDKERARRLAEEIGRNPHDSNQTPFVMVLEDRETFEQQMSFAKSVSANRILYARILYTCKARIRHVDECEPYTVCPYLYAHIRTVYCMPCMPNRIRYTVYEPYTVYQLLFQ